MKAALSVSLSKLLSTAEDSLNYLLPLIFPFMWPFDDFFSPDCFEPIIGAFYYDSTLSLTLSDSLTLASPLDFLSPDSAPLDFFFYESSFDFLRWTDPTGVSSGKLITGSSSSFILSFLKNFFLPVFGVGLSLSVLV
jgi:hypothetical protein